MTKCRTALVATVLATFPGLPARADAMPPQHSPAETSLQLTIQRRDQLNLHQGLALGALGGLLASGVSGQILSSGAIDPAYNDALTASHVGLAITAVLLYGGAATAALTAPPAPAPWTASGAADTSNWHRGLSWVHAAGLGSTVALGTLTLLNDPRLATAHQVTAWSTIALMSVSGGLLVVGF